ncbi:hypothetical protein MSAN_00117500 [Mycena sanguinolenta]|uniref:Protein kinase domain-containing protein n=1 Tax=Mycena sanguinolenta TaxID=230812 RepID=A0A8H6ZHJ6_9AGAR|nr:hypothetical protein MSAN_00117500 [Mycena sanguinolenta]
MDERPHPEPEFIYSSTCESGSPSHTSGMFSHSQQFTVAGGTFTNIINPATAPSLPSDFRMIPMGDIDLRHQIRVDQCTGIAYPQRPRACVRRMHSAKAIIAGRKSRVTVAVYQGNDAEEEWRQDIAKYMSMRHPNIIQICGAASSNGLHAILFNDDLIPLLEVLDRHRGSHFSTVYIYAHCNQEFSQVHNYIDSEFQLRLYSPECTNWIRRSSGRLCTELTPANGDKLWLDWRPSESSAMPGTYSWSTGAETITTFIDLLTLEQYYHICDRNLIQHRCITISTSTMVNIGAVIRCFNDVLEDSVEIAFLPSAGQLGDWTIFEENTGEVMPNGCTRFQSHDVINSTVYLSCSLLSDRNTWLSQANHIFDCLQILSNFEDYVVVDFIRFDLDILQTTGNLPEGFLFLCPQEDFRTGPSSFGWPPCVGYWSLSPSGVDRLNSEDASRLGFPSFRLTTTADGWYWDSSVYEGLCQFHKAKGFDPYSQDVARHLGVQIYQLSPQVDAPLAYVDSEGKEFDADIDSDCNSARAEDYESEYSPTLACDDSDPEHREESNGTNHDASEPTVEEDMVAEETPVLSPTFRVLINIQFMLILFLALSEVHDHVW